ALARPADQLARAHVGTRLSDHDGLHRLTPTLVGHAYHRDVGPGGMAEQGPPDLGGIDVLAARHDHVLHAVVDVEVALVVEVARVAGEEPVALEGAPGGVGKVPVAAHDLPRAHGDLADLARRHVLAVVSDDAQLHTFLGVAAGQELLDVARVVIGGR